MIDDITLLHVKKLLINYTNISIDDMQIKVNLHLEVDCHVTITR
jgi:hypothetical protein